MLVGLIATVVMFQVFAVSEGQKRTTTGAGDAQQSGLVSLYQLERDIRMAGFGLNLPSLFGCTTRGWSEESNIAVSFKLVPITTVAGGADVPDRLTIVYGSNDDTTSPERLQAPVTTASGNYMVRNRFGFTLGDAVVVGEAGKECTLAQVSALPNTAEIGHASGSYVLATKTYTTKYNKPGGYIASGSGYIAWVKATNSGGRVFNLGPQPNVVQYAVEGNALVVTDLLNPASRVTIADGVVQFKVQYGFDANGDGEMNTVTNVAVIDEALGDQWGDAVPATLSAQGWSRITAVRLAVVTRSMQPEKPRADGTCDTTADGPIWYARTTDLASPYRIDVSGSGADWKCFRYRTFEVTVPLRNVAWFPDENL
jgi:type IV pilus assembly protein PilW